jgi:hypothetical protein
MTQKQIKEYSTRFLIESMKHKGSCDYCYHTSLRILKELEIRLQRSLTEIQIALEHKRLGEGSKELISELNKLKQEILNPKTN